ANIGLLVSALYGRSYQTSFKAICSGSSAYCSSGDQNCSDGDKFTSVILYKTSDPSNLLINNTDGTCSGSGYQDFTNINVNLEPGENYTIKVKCGYSSQQVGGWVDINGNNIFDNNEKLITLNCSTSGQEYTTTFTIPQDFAPGAHRFRLVSKYNAAPTPCGNSSYGQTHDYTVTFPELYHRVQNVNAELFAEEEIITITWEAPEEGTPIGYNIYREGNLLNTELLNVTTFTEEDITEGIYVYNVTAVYEGDKESFAEMSNVICNYENITPPLPCETPVNLSGEVDENECIVAVIRWNMLEGIDGVILLNYNIYRDNVKIAEALPSDQEYRDELSENGTYVYHVSAVYEHCEESPWTGEVTVEISCVNINEVQADVFQIFPNPAKGELNITGAVIPTYVSIYNLMGQTMYETGQCAPNMKISVSSLPTGIYFVKIVSENGTTTKKVVVEN
ncbi:MAG: T9SS type A sorting domain-containing protein, partial [Firmicutes bacterium]|nr:T9SS type A sorting domain-containing protein [Bacillota bacterium]